MCAAIIEASRYLSNRRVRRCAQKATLLRYTGRAIPAVNCFKMQVYPSNRKQAQIRLCMTSLKAVIHFRRQSRPPQAGLPVLMPGREHRTASQPGLRANVFGFSPAHVG